MTNDGTRTSAQPPRALAQPSDEDTDLVAATVILARDSANGPEVLLIERPNRGSFAGAWVFPGGKLDPEDADGFDGEPTEVEVARRAGVREAWEETGLVTNEADYVTFSCWVPPAMIAHRRIRTWFFVAPAPEGDLVLSEAEAVDARWIRPEDAIDLHTKDEFSLFPPTWVTLADLTGFADAAAMIAASRASEPRQFKSRSLSAQKALLWEGDGAYETALDATPRPDSETTDRNRLDMSVTPWVLQRVGASARA